MGKALQGANMQKLISAIHWIHNKLFGCKCNSFGYGTCVKCSKEYKRVKEAKE